MAKNEGGNRPRVRIEDEEPRKRGRPMNSMNRFAKESRERARETGALPHELLLAWARGEPMTRKVLREEGDPTNPEDWIIEYSALEADDIRDSAKAAAPYYAPKISTVEVIAGVSDADLDEFIARAAAEAGVSLGAGGEGTKDPRDSSEDD